MFSPMASPVPFTSRKPRRSARRGEPLDGEGGSRVESQWLSVMLTGRTSTPWRWASLTSEEAL
jgi:hypothetical protein